MCLEQFILLLLFFCLMKYLNKKSIGSVHKLHPLFFDKRDIEVVAKVFRLTFYFIAFLVIKVMLLPVDLLKDSIMRFITRNAMK